LPPHGICRAHVQRAGIEPARAQAFACEPAGLVDAARALHSRRPKRRGFDRPGELIQICIDVPTTAIECE
jgi:hypothetical protein